MKSNERVFTITIENLVTKVSRTESHCAISAKAARAQYLENHPTFANEEKYRVTAELDKDCDLNYCL